MTNENSRATRTGAESDRTAGATIVLVPGLLCDGHVWSGVIEPLARHHRVAVADLSTQDSIEAMARDVLASTPGTLLVAGHSMGGRVALEMVRQAPERIARLALFDTGVHPRVEGEEALRRKRVDLAHEHGMDALAADWLPPMVHPDRHADAALMGPLTAMVKRMDAQLHERQIRALLDRPDARPLLAGIGCPTLLAVGRQDGWSPVAQHKEMLAAIPGSKLVVIEDAGHFAPVERPQATVQALLDWLRM